MTFPPTRFEYLKTLAIVPGRNDPHHDICPICLDRWENPETQFRAHNAHGSGL